ncbi:MAG: class I SAM-dependent methyltransferase [Methanoregula sp.]|nr:class I SAM-dependent methyltransferase [Methanoregula sp.]
MNPAVDIFDRYVDDYDQWFDVNKGIYAAQVDYLRRYITNTDKGLEIGVGSGMFASRLGIRHGLDPSPRLLVMARQRGVETVQGKGENLPYRAGTFDTALMMTVICFMEDVTRSFREAYRIIRAGGTLVVAIMEKDGEVARRERNRNPAGRFLHHAKFLTADQVMAALTSAGFSGVCVGENLHGICIITAQKE